MTHAFLHVPFCVCVSDIIVNQSTELVKINENCFEYLKVVSCSSNLLFMR